MAVKRFKFGWFGDGGHGEQVIQMILAGRKKAATCLAYEAEDSEVHIGDVLELVDKRSRCYGTVAITRIDLRLFGTFDEALAHDCGHTLKELRDRIKFANSREPRADEEMRVTYFQLVSVTKIRLPNGP